MRADSSRKHGQGVWPRSLSAGPRSGTIKSNRRQAFNLPGQAHFLTFSCFRRAELLAEDTACARLAACLDAARTEYAFDLWAYVFMPDHVHLLIRPRREKYSIAAILHSIKGLFAKWLVEDWKIRHPQRLGQLEASLRTRKRYRIWQRGGGFDRNLFSYDLIRRAVDYIEFNPVRSGLVENPEDWVWSSFGARMGKADAPIRVQEVDWNCVLEK